MDFIGYIPTETSLNVFSHLEAREACRSCQVSKTWRKLLANDNNFWKLNFPFINFPSNVKIKKYIDTHTIKSHSAIIDRFQEFTNKLLLGQKGIFSCQFAFDPQYKIQVELQFNVELGDLLSFQNSKKEMTTSSGEPLYYNGLAPKKIVFNSSHPILEETFIFMKVLPPDTEFNPENQPPLNITPNRSSTFYALSCIPICLNEYVQIKCDISYPTSIYTKEFLLQFREQIDTHLEKEHKIKTETYLSEVEELESKFCQYFVIGTAIGTNLLFRTIFT